MDEPVMFDHCLNNFELIKIIFKSYKLTHRINILKEHTSAYQIDLFTNKRLLTKITGAGVDTFDGRLFHKYSEKYLSM